MYSGSTTDHRFLSTPMEVYWAGWQTDTLRLQQAGWELSAEQDIYRAAMRLGIRHQSAQMYGISSPVNLDYQRHYYEGSRAPNIPIQMAYLATKVTVNVMDDLSNFQPIDATPQFVNGPAAQIKNIEDFGIWALPMARSEEIIVDPHDVDQLLKMIRDVQLPEQEAIRERNRLRESREGLSVDHQPRQQFHAQILSIAS